MQKIYLLTSNLLHYAAVLIHGRITGLAGPSVRPSVRLSVSPAPISVQRGIRTWKRNGAEQPKLAWIIPGQQWPVCQCFAQRSEVKGQRSEVRGQY